ncbi:MAG: histidine--tRNA ligase [Thermoplasmata archaeon]
MNYEPLKGFREFYPEQQWGKRVILEKIEEVVKLFGFEEISTPSVESLELFKMKSGDEIVEETYSFKDKGNRDVVLIPETTPAVSRMVSEISKISTFPLRWYSYSKVWRYEEPQKGRMREFYQFNVDIFGTKNPVVDAEILYIAYMIMKNLDLDNDVQIRVSHRNLISSLTNGMCDNNKLYKLIDKKHKIPANEFDSSLKEICPNNELYIKIKKILEIKSPINKGIEELNNSIEGDILKELNQLEEALKMYGIEDKIILDPSIVRGLLYYTGIVFECWDKKEELRAIFGGGRYDNLVGLFNKTPIPAIGFAIGDVTLELLLKKENKWPVYKEKKGVYAILIYENYLGVAIKMITKIRNAGIKVTFDYAAKPIQKGLEIASKGMYEYCLIFGKEIEEGNVIIKNMETKEQITIQQDMVEQFFIKELNKKAIHGINDAN